MSKPLTNQLVLFAFCAWLTTRRGTLQVGESHDAAETCALLEEFIEWNDIHCADDIEFHECMYPPRLWYRYTPALGAIEWWVRKKYRDAKLAFAQLFGDPHTCP